MFQEYEQWFSETFPNVTRPQTAPAAMSRGGKKEASGANTATNHKAGKSAPPGGRKRPDSSASVDSD